MRLHHLYRSIREKHPGQVSVLFALLIPILLGMVGLVIDLGLLMAADRQAQNAADAAAMAAAIRLFRSEPLNAARDEANTFVQQNLTNPPTLTLNGGNTNAINIPPIQGPHAGNSQYAEVFLTNTINTLFIHILGVNQSQSAAARAVAGYEALADGEGAIVLDPSARPGIDVTGNSTLKVEGAVLVNSRSAGSDQYGGWVDWGYTQYAATTSNNATVQARYIQVRGGVDTPGNYRNIDPNGPSPLFCKGPIAPDPLRLLPVPTVVSPYQRPVTVQNGETRVFDPGIYEDIQINTGANVTFNPGTYILMPNKPNQGLRCNGNSTITADGVMFYMTGSNYLDNGLDGQPGVAAVDDDGDGFIDLEPGADGIPGNADDVPDLDELGWWSSDDQAAYYDTLDGHIDGPLPPTNGPDTLPPPPDANFNQVKFATVDLNLSDADATFRGLQDPNSPFNDMLFYQRRRNDSDFSIQANAGSNVLLDGTVYAKWAKFKVSGESRYDSMFVVGSMAVSGGATVILHSTGRNFGLALQVFLVE